MRRKERKSDLYVQKFLPTPDIIHYERKDVPERNAGLYMRYCITSSSWKELQADIFNVKLNSREKKMEKKEEDKGILFIIMNRIVHIKPFKAVQIFKQM